MDGLLPRQRGQRRGADERGAARGRGLIRALAAAGALLVAAMVTAGAETLLAVGWLRWLDPPGSAFMLYRRAGWFWDAAPCAEVEHHWVDRRRIADPMGIAVVAAEDQRFPTHRGFDLAAIADAVDEAREGDRLRGASTISQQLAKNLFLWPGRSWIRKSAEAPLTLALELSLSKPRILELYLNSAQLGPCTFGVEAAARRYWGIPATELDTNRAALLAATLPSPFRSRPDEPSDYLRERGRWIEAQMAQLGGPAYLRTPATRQR